ncbi:MAG: AI-2E family transporter [Lachnospiraceae bacterium]|nr:AI-2E family transporter [Lachnospiraceae bacterium]
MKRKFKDEKWYSLAVAICIGVLFHFLLNHLGDIGNMFGNIGYFVYPLVAGGILAYLINPLMRIFENRLFKGIKNDKVKRIISLVLSLLIVIVFFVLVIGMLVPQIYQSVARLYANKDEYFAALSEWMKNIGAGSILKNFEGLFGASSNMIVALSDFISQNSEAIENGVARFGGHIGSWAIGMIFSVYFLVEKEKIADFMYGILKRIKKDDEKRERTMTHIKRIDYILTRYIILSITDGIIVGAVNAIFMAVTHMQYTGLVSVIVGVTNLIPTFGPVIGAAIGGLILLLVNPVHALYFLIFTVILQTIDGYILKPKMFGDTFGVSGLWILIAIIVGGRIFGVLGIILAIPFVAILDYLIRNVYTPYRDSKEKENEINEA